MYGTMTPIDVSAKYGEPDTLSYLIPPKINKDQLLFSHTHNVHTLSCALWRLINLDPITNSIKVQKYALPAMQKLQPIYLNHLFPRIEEPRVQEWWVRNLKRSKVPYVTSIGTLSRRFGLITPIVSNVSIDFRMLRMLYAFYKMLGYTPSPNNWTSFAYHLPLDCLVGKTNKEKVTMLEAALPKPYMRNIFSIFGDDIELNLRIAKRCSTRVTLDYDEYSKTSVRVDTKLCAAIRDTWASNAGSTGQGMLFTRRTKEVQLKKMVKHFEKHRFNTIILDA